MKGGLLLLVLFCLFYRISCVGDVGHDRPYGDLPGMPITLKDDQTHLDCYKLCQQNNDCFSWVFRNSSLEDCGEVKLCWLKNIVPPQSPNRCMVSGVKGRKLERLPYDNFRLGEITPKGWLHRQMTTQAQGLSGYLAMFWPYIANSTWIGGDTEDPFGLNERVPYWMNGITPLAFMLKDKNLLNQVYQYTDYIISHQTEDGWYGTDCCDIWPRYPLLLAFKQYAEGNQSDTRVVPSMYKFLHYVRDQIDQKPLTEWAQYRWQDLLLSIYWLYDNHPEGQEDFLLDLAEQIEEQGFDWKGFFDSPQFPRAACTGGCQSLATHGVNVGQALKSSAVWWRQSGSILDKDSTYQRLETLYKYHGQASGIFSEHLAGLFPSQGSELCTVVETIFSIAKIFNSYGDITHADLIEKLTFNSLPAAISPDMWSHVYLQQGNQVNSKSVDPYIYVSDGPESNLYGLEPNYGCCTANYHMGWPQYVSHMFLKTAHPGITAALYGPVHLSTILLGKSVEILATTDYPFNETIHFQVTSEVVFPFFLRIPAWCNGAQVVVTNEEGTTKYHPSASQYQQVEILEGKTQITLTLPMKFHSERRFNNAISISRGPLVYALKIGEQWEETHHYAYDSSDWDIEPTTPWSYALRVDENDLESSVTFVHKKLKEDSIPFSPETVPVHALVNAKLIEWGETNNAADAPPMSPVESDSPLEQVTLIPYGATQLRMVELPTLAADEDMVMVK